MRVCGTDARQPASTSKWSRRLTLPECTAWTRSADIRICSGYGRNRISQGSSGDTQSSCMPCAHKERDSFTKKSGGGPRDGTTPEPPGGMFEMVLFDSET